MKARWGRGLLILAVMLSLAAAATAQDPGNTTEPIVQFEDHTIEEPITPLSDPGTVTMTVGVGCDALESPDTETQATLQAPDEPAYAIVDIAPGQISWTTEPGQCPSLEPVHLADITVEVVFTQNAPAFQEVPLDLAMTVQKTPDPEDQRQYGPYTATITATPGYFNLYNMAVDEVNKEAPADETATFEVRVDDFSNDETRFTFSAPDAPEDVTVQFDPDPLTLDAGEQGTFEAHVRLSDPSTLPGSTTYEVPIEIESASTNPQAGPGDSTTLTLMPTFQGLLANPTPGPGVVTALVVMVVVSIGSTLPPKRPRL